MTYSVVFSLPGAVRSMLEVADGLGDWHVMTGPRRTPAGAKELAVQEMRAPASRPVTGGIRREEGTFVIRAYAEVAGSGEEAIDAVRAEVDAGLGYAAAALEDDKTIGGTVRFCDVVEVAEDDQSIAEAPGGHTFTAHITVSFTADVVPGA